MRFTTAIIGALLCIITNVTAQQRPNILYIMSDDHDADAISAYNTGLIATPNIDRLAKEGMRFSKAFVGNAICGPSRATLITGQHSHKNGVRTNRDAMDPARENIAKTLQQAGYQTALIGKWHLHQYPSGFNYWKILPGQGQYITPRFIHMNGDSVNYKGYATDVITDEALSWLRNRDQSKPFLLLLHHKAPHRYFLAPIKYIDQYRNKKFPEPSTLYASKEGRGKAWLLQTMSILPDMKLSSDLKVDPKYLEDIPALKPDSAEAAYYKAIMNRIPEPDRTRIKQLYAYRGEIIQRERPTGNKLLAYKYQWYLQDYMATVASIDENIGRVLDYLDSANLTKNTMTLYTSDQGFYLGENGWFDKRFMYDVSMQTPLLVRWPGHIKPGTVSNALVQNIDFAPTMIQATGTTIPTYMQGTSFLPVLTGAKKKLDRPYLYYHFYEYKADHTVLQHLGIRGNRYKLIYFYTVNEWEFYDLEKDPQEQHNLINVKQYLPTIERMKLDLVQVRKNYGDTEPVGQVTPAAP
ncbi:sulfatase [Paraflavitalea pollutisoli]|uniref:sulfatase family protein n=1 Tax=Paraflavitalea pollutisoli TaxID=3034143 RepID=UPI0023EACCB5|nr:sulfatase [Paraflavitalea sp. H1-2-19X]